MCQYKYAHLSRVLRRIAQERRILSDGIPVRSAIGQSLRMSFLRLTESNRFIVRFYRPCHGDNELEATCSFCFQIFKSFSRSC